MANFVLSAGSKSNTKSAAGKKESRLLGFLNLSVKLEDGFKQVKCDSNSVFASRINSFAFAAIAAGKQVQILARVALPKSTMPEIEGFEYEWPEAKSIGYINYFMVDSTGAEFALTGIHALADNALNQALVQYVTASGSSDDLTFEVRAHVADDQATEGTEFKFA